MDEYEYSKYFDNDDHIVTLKRERRLIISETIEKETIGEEEEREKSWEWDDGGQTMEELDKMEQFEEKIKKLGIFESKDQPNFFKIFFYKWKNIINNNDFHSDNESINEKKDSKEESIDKPKENVYIIDNNKDNDNINNSGDNFNDKMPEIIHESKPEESDQNNNTYQKGLNNEENEDNNNNIIKEGKIIKDIPERSDEIQIEQNIPNNPLIKETEYPFIIRDWFLEDKSDLINKKPKKKFDKINMISNLALFNNLDISSPDYNFPELDVRKNLIPDLLTKTTKELIPIKIRKKGKNIDIKNYEQNNKYEYIRPDNPIIKKVEEVKIEKDEINDNKNILDTFDKKKKDIKKEFDKYNNNENIDNIKDINIEKDYYLKNLNDLTKNDKNISNDIEITGTEYQINPNDKIFDKYFIDNKNTIDNLDIINNNIQNNLTEEKIKINPDILKDNFNPEMIKTPLEQEPEKIKKQECKIINDIPSYNEKLIYEQIRPNNPINNNISLPIIDKEQLSDNSYEISKRPKSLIDKINIIDYLNIHNNLNLINPEYNYINKNETKGKLRNKNRNRNKIIISDENIKNNNSELIPNIINKISDSLLNLKEIDIDKKINKLCVINEKPKEKKEIEIKKNYLNIEYNNKNIKNDENIIPLLFNDYQLSNINKNIIKKYNNNINIINNEEIKNNNIKLENEIINIKNKNNLNINDIKNEYKLNQKPEKIKESNKINLIDKIFISDNINLPKTKFILNENKNILISNIKMQSNYSILNPIEIMLPKKKYQTKENPKEIKKIEIIKDYINKKYQFINDKLKNDLNIISNDYQINIPENINKIRINIINTIENEKLKENDIIPLKEEKPNLNNDKIQNQFILPKISKLTLIQNPEKICASKMIDNIPNISEDVVKEQVKLNEPKKRNIESIDIKNDDLFEDSDDIKKLNKKTINTINITEDIYPDIKIELLNPKFEIKNKKGNINNLIPKLISNKNIEISPIPISLKLQKEKYNIIEKLEEKKEIEIKKDYLNIEYNDKNIKNNENIIPLLFNDYQLSNINKNIIKKYNNNINIINNEEIKNNNIKLENEIINIKNKNNLNINDIKNEYKLNQKPEKIKESNKINLPDKIFISDNIKPNLPNYSIDSNKSKIEFPKLLSYSPNLDIIEISKKLKKSSCLESPKEIKDIKINYNYTSKIPLLSQTKELTENQDKYISIDYQIFIPKKESKSQVLNIIQNENIISNDVIPLKQDNSLQDNSLENKYKFNLPKTAIYHMVQNPEKIKKSQIVEIFDNIYEINTEPVKVNNPIERKIKEQNIIDDKIFDDKDELMKKYKKTLNKINIIDDIKLNDKIEILNSVNYEYKDKKENKNQFIPSIINTQIDIKPIKFTSKLNLEKYNSKENPREINDINIIKNYAKKKIEYVPLNKDIPLPMISSFYQLPKLTSLLDSLNKKIGNDKLKNKKQLLPEAINIIDNVKIQNNVSNLEKDDLIKFNIGKNNYNLMPLIPHKLSQKPEKMFKLIGINDKIEEINIEKNYINNPIKKEVNKILIEKDEINNDKNDLIQKKPKKLLLKTNIIENPKPFNNIQLQNPEYSLKNKININLINNTYAELKPIKEIKKSRKINKKLLDEFDEGESNQKLDKNSTLFKFYDSNNRQLFEFNCSEISKNNTDNEIQTQFFNFMHKKFLAFKNKEESNLNYGHKNKK